MNASGLARTMISKIFLLAASIALACHADWPQFRGPGASGVDQSMPLPIHWNFETGENVAWRTEIPGLAHSSPIIWKDRIYLTTVTGGKGDLKVGLYGEIGAANDNGPQVWRVLALDKNSGKIVWDKEGHRAVPRVQRHTKATHCNSTPATDGTHIVTYFGSEGLFCFDSEGALLWQKDLGPMDSGFFMVPSAQWGFASSPVIFDGKVVVQCDVQTNSFLALLNIEDGREIWRAPRKDVPTWSTPTIARIAGGQTGILVNGWHQNGAYDFLTGREIWKLDGGGDIPVPTPVLGDSVAFFTSAHGRFRPMSAIRLDAVGDITPKEVGATNAAIIWSHARQGNYMQTPILVGNFLYGCNDAGVLTCFDAKTGAIQFSERLTSSGQGFTASPVSDGRHLYFPSETGNSFVVKAEPKFSVVATNSLGETCMSSPAISDGQLLFRTRSHLVCLRQK
jgi:outer membrane protein assembly factor BamB